MINPKKIAKFAAKLLAILLPILGVVFALDLLAGFIFRRDTLAPVTRSWQFWSALLLGVLPSVVALVAAYLLAVRYVKRLYGIESMAEARSFLNRCLFGMSAFKPFLRVSGGKIEGDPNDILQRAGGPGHLVVYHDNQALLERGGRLTRVVGTGYVLLEPMEKIYHVVELRPKRQVLPVSAMSIEGIPITCEADISYQIDNEGIAPTEEAPYPAAEEKVFQAATCAWIRDANQSKENRIRDWGGRVIDSETAGTLRTLLADYSLDRLIGLSNLSQGNAREEIRQQLKDRLDASVPKLGAKILNVELGDIKLQDSVTQQWVRAWKADWSHRATTRQAMGRATQAKQLEEAKNQAQLMLLTSITEAFQPMVEHQQEVTSKLVLARLFMVLSRAPADPLTRVNLPHEAINTLKLLKDLVV